MIAAGPAVVGVEKFYTAPPERVWHALTTPESMARWLMEPTGFEPMAGSRFTFAPSRYPRRGSPARSPAR